jgi:hypothetical protein
MTETTDNDDIARRLLRKFQRVGQEISGSMTKNDHRRIAPDANDLSTWENCENGRLAGPLVLVAGTAIHLEAIEVVVDEEDGTMEVAPAVDYLGEQLLAAFEDDMCSACDVIRFAGKQYVIHAAPAPAPAEDLARMIEEGTRAK